VLVTNANIVLLSAIFEQSFEIFQVEVVATVENSKVTSMLLLICTMLPLLLKVNTAYLLFIVYFASRQLAEDAKNCHSPVGRVTALIYT
jgi:hypothetical protein